MFSKLPKSEKAVLLKVILKILKDLELPISHTCLKTEIANYQKINLVHYLPITADLYQDVFTYFKNVLGSYDGSTLTVRQVDEEPSESVGSDSHESAKSDEKDLHVLEKMIDANIILAGEDGEDDSEEEDYYYYEEDTEETGDPEEPLPEAKVLPPVIKIEQSKILSSLPKVEDVKKIVPPPTKTAIAPATVIDEREESSTEYEEVEEEYEDEEETSEGGEEPTHEEILEMRANAKNRVKEFVEDRPAIKVALHRLIERMVAESEMEEDWGEEEYYEESEDVSEIGPEEPTKEPVKPVEVKTPAPKTPAITKEPLPVPAPTPKKTPAPVNPPIAPAVQEQDSSDMYEEEYYYEESNESEEAVVPDPQPKTPAKPKTEAPVILPAPTVVPETPVPSKAQKKTQETVEDSSDGEEEEYEEYEEVSEDEEAPAPVTAKEVQPPKAVAPILAAKPAALAANGPEKQPSPPSSEMEEEEYEEYEEESSESSAPPPPPPVKDVKGRKVATAPPKKTGPKTAAPEPRKQVAAAKPQPQKGPSTPGVAGQRRQPPGLRYQTSPPHTRNRGQGSVVPPVGKRTPGPAGPAATRGGRR